MRDWYRIVALLVLLTLIFIAAPVVLAQDELTVITDPASDITSDSATLNGNLISPGNATPVTVSFQWATDDYYTNNVVSPYDNETPTQSMSTPDTFNFPIISLAPSTIYHFRAKAVGNSTTYGDDLTFTTAIALELQGWGWCTNFNEVVAVTFEGYLTMIERDNAPDSYSMHAIGNLTLPSPYNETVTLDMYGNRVRSLFYLRQEVTGKSATFEGTWLDASGNQSYISMGGTIALPNLEGTVLKTTRLCSIYLRTPDVEVPLTEPGSFVEDVESMLTRFVKFIDKFIDSLIGTGFSDILSNILSKTAVLLASLRALGTPYIP